MSKQLEKCSTWELLVSYVSETLIGYLKHMQKYTMEAKSMERRRAKKSPVAFNKASSSSVSTAIMTGFIKSLGICFSL